VLFIIVGFKPTVCNSFQTEADGVWLRFTLNERKEAIFRR
jgi:hypothetical protein